MGVLFVTSLIVMTICAIGWSVNYVGTKALLLYIKAKGYRVPSKQEIKKYTRYAAKHTLGIEVEDINQILND